MIWVDRVVDQLKKRKLKLEWVDDMKTPSGRIHVGALRGVVIHDLVYKVLVENDVKAKFTYVFDDHDPMDAIPAYLDFRKWEKYAGMPLCRIPSPEKGFSTYAEYYAKEFIDVFQSINCHPEIIWTSQLYRSGKMNAVIKEVLDAAPQIRAIYFKVAKAKKPSDWYPFNVICEKCGKVGTTQVYHWDGKLVSYRCLPKIVDWAVGCGYEGEISPYNGNGKLPWKVDWPAKWKVLGVTVEGAGKDHMSAGGSHDMAKAICKEIFHYPVPYPIPYEWFIIGGKKMSSSKGIGASAKEVSQILPSDVFRFLIVRTPIGTALDFNPYGETILNLFDDYDRCLSAYFDKKERHLSKGKQGEVLADFARIIELSQVRMLPDKRPFLPRFRTIVNFMKAKTDILKFFEKQKGKKLTAEEEEILEERIVFAQVYLKSYADRETKINFLEKLPANLKLTANQKEYLKNLSENLSKIRSEKREEIQNIVFTVLRKGNYKAKEVFPGFYQILIGRDFGPKAADLILEFSIDKVIKRLKEI